MKCNRNTYTESHLFEVKQREQCYFTPVHVNQTYDISFPSFLQMNNRNIFNETLIQMADGERSSNSDGNSGGTTADPSYLNFDPSD